MYKDLSKVKADLKLSASDESYDGANCFDGFVHSGFLSSVKVSNELFDGVYMLDPHSEFRVLEDELGEVLHHLDLSLGRLSLSDDFGIGLSKSVSAIAFTVASPSFPPSLSTASFVATSLLLGLRSTVGPESTMCGNSFGTRSSSLLCSCCGSFGMLLCSCCDLFSVLPNFTEGFGSQDGLNLSLFRHLGGVLDGDSRGEGSNCEDDE